jgi:DNA-binding NarL/FixJ family response regulator
MAKLFCTDDVPLHLTMVQSTLKMLAAKGLQTEIIGTATNGQEAINKYQTLFNTKNLPDVMTLDIRMPTLDGLSALVKIKHLNPNQKIVMVSSEDESTVSKTKIVHQISDAEKFDLIQKVATRVKGGSSEPGKINQILQACDELHINPIQVAKQLGANGYIHKPYDADKTLLVINAVLANKPFTSAI